MITVVLKGGMGNQLFQYSLGLYLSVLNSSELVLDLTYLNNSPAFIVKRDYSLEMFNINHKCINQNTFNPLFSNIGRSEILRYAKINRFANIFSNIIYVSETKPFIYDHKLISLKGNLYLNGYWQNYKYIENINNLIKEKFSIKSEYLLNCSELYNLISNSESVCVNIRRTDFVINKLYGDTSIDYYRNAYNYIKEKLNKPIFVINSDDIEWCKKNLQFMEPKIYIELENDYKYITQFYLMKNCKHFIIPNSTFAWWAAFLSDNKRKIVITPRKWFKDGKINHTGLIPSDWIML
jgi:hypothetical protein